VVKSENRQHFERTRADELVVSAELTGALLAAAARTHGLTAVIADLLTHPEGQELYRVPAPPEVAGQTVRFALEQMKDVHESLLVGVYDGNQCAVNPPSNTVIPPGADLLVVRERPIDARY
jgi:Trk K+ transport system NAD-binding subunit